MGTVNAKSFQKNDSSFELNSEINEHEKVESHGDFKENDLYSNPELFKKNIPVSEINSNDNFQGNDPNIRPQNIKAKVEVIHVDGLARTKDDVIVKLVKDFFSANDIKEVIYASFKVKRRLESLNAFDTVGIELNTNNAPGASPHGIDVNISVKEKNRYCGDFKTLFGNNEGNLVFSAMFPNLLGRGELFQCDYQCGRKNSGFNVAFSKPLINLESVRLITALFQQGYECPWSGYKQLDRGIFTDVSFNSFPNVNHTLRWEGIWRELNCLTPNTGFAVREEIGHSCKSSIKHILKVDNRDALVFPSIGSFIKLQQELSGIGGNVNIIKHELEYQTNYPLPFDWILQGCFAAGILKGWGAEKYYNISDRFFLGGPLSIRGFQMCGVGPQSEGNALGAESYWAGALHLYTPLPYLPLSRYGHLFRTHFFINTGNIGNFTLAEDYHHYLRSILSNMRWSYGAGLVLSLGDIARIELNYAIPFKSQPQDKVNPGLQFGIGLSFL